MATVSDSVLPDQWTFAELVQSLGDIPLGRIRAVPPPGTATEEDVLRAESRFGRICELIDGMLVEKTMGYYESLLASLLIRWLGNFVDQDDLGIILGEAGTLKVLPGQVRIPDVCFIAWDRFPNRRLPADPIPAIAPDLAIEVLSKGNTPGEMTRKLHDYFRAGVRLVWYLDPDARTLHSYTSAERCETLREGDLVTAGDVLPGFQFRLGDLFAQARM